MQLGPTVKVEAAPINFRNPNLISEIPDIFPKETTKKFVEVNTGEVIYLLKD